MNSSPQYLSVVETAKLVRKRLALKFPGIKFSVRSESYSGGASIHIRWTDGPATRLVEPVVRQFRGSDFDGMIDLKVYAQSWLLPDGTAELAYQPGPTGSLSEVVTDAPHPNAILVHFGADHVFCNRHQTNWEQQEAEAASIIRKECHCTGEPPNDQFGNQWVRNLASNVVWSRSEDETMETAFRRVVLQEEEEVT